MDFILQVTLMESIQVNLEIFAEFNIVTLGPAFQNHPQQRNIRKIGSRIRVRVKRFVFDPAATYI